MSSTKSPGSKLLSINFVCTGNICRSPTAEWVLKQKLTEQNLLDLVEVRSSGTQGHVGWSADDRSEKYAKKRGYDLSKHRASRLCREDYNECDLLLALDSGHLSYMRRQATTGQQAKLRLMCDYAAKSNGQDCPDPYYDRDEAFELVLDMVEDACDGLLATIQSALDSADPATAILTPVAPLYQHQGSRSSRAGAMPAPKR